MDLPCSEQKASVEGGCGQQVKEAQKRPQPQPGEGGQQRLRGKNPVAEGIQGEHSPAGTDDSRCSEWWARPVLGGGEAEPRKMSGAGSWMRNPGMGRRRWRLWQNGTEEEKVERGRQGSGPGPTRRAGGWWAREAWTHLWWPPRTRAPCAACHEAR